MSNINNNNNEVKKVTDINKKFIEKFVTNRATLEDLIWIQTIKSRCIEDKKHAIRENSIGLTEEDITKKANREYFATFRSEFAKKFYPELVAKKEATKGVDSLTAAINARYMELLAA